MNIARILIVALAAILLHGCATPAPPEGGYEGVQQFAEGIRNYENGKHNEAASNLMASLYLGLSESDQVLAHKYLAFTYCAAEREDQCRSEFRKALSIDSAFELSAAEAGHPAWGPIFREIKDQ